jgi:hypothetical protein
MASKSDGALFGGMGFLHNFLSEFGQNLVVSSVERTGRSAENLGCFNKSEVSPKDRHQKFPVFAGEGVKGGPKADGILRAAESLKGIRMAGLGLGDPHFPFFTPEALSVGFGPKAPECLPKPGFWMVWGNGQASQSQKSCLNQILGGCLVPDQLMSQRTQHWRVFVHQQG